MTNQEWLEILGWGKEELDDLRFVGYSYLKQGHYDTAITFFETLIILAPESAYDLQTLGALYLQKGNNIAALNFIEKSLRIDPNHILTLLNRTKALFSLGYKRQAFLQAQELVKHADPRIAGQAAALMLAYGGKAA
ncbi:MAG: type III secretion chaperone [Simkania sp.]|nr:type III secretion chaperone [Simkania sp.]